VAPHPHHRDGLPAVPARVTASFACCLTCLKESAAAPSGVALAWRPVRSRGPGGRSVRHAILECALMASKKVDARLKRLEDRVGAPMRYGRRGGATTGSSAVHCNGG